MTTFTETIDVETLGPQPCPFHLVATAEEKKSIARQLGLISLELFKADIILRKKELIEMRGTLTANVVQQCVRTLKPFSHHLIFDIEEFFTRVSADAEDENLLAFEEEINAEVLKSPYLDLGSILVQILSLALDPYPRDPTSSPVAYMEDQSSSSPFNVLRKKT